MDINTLAEKYDLNAQEREELREYLTNAFDGKEMISENDMSFLEKWKEICEYSRIYGGDKALNKFVTAKRPVDFISPDGVKIEIYSSFAGEIPVIYIKNSEDFESFIINAIYKGVRPDNISETGASFAFGRTTRFMTLSAKPYSNVPASEMGFSETEWREKSMVIRREHECTHYFTKQTFGVSRNNLHDELIADFFGIYEAFGEYKAKYFQKFTGTSAASGGRLKFYISELSEKVRPAIYDVARRSSEYLEEYSRTDEFLKMNHSERITKLCQTGLLSMI